MSNIKILAAAGALLLTSMLTGCGSSTSPIQVPTTPPSSSDPPSTPDTPAPIEGVALPSTVSVVTAINAS